MSARAFYQGVLCAIAMISVLSEAYGLTPEEVAVKLERAGYSQIREVKSGKITTFKAVKDGKIVSLVVDSSGHFKELP
jgi:hypothetical protein